MPPPRVEAGALAPAAAPALARPMPNAKCPMPNAKCQMPNAQCPMPNWLDLKVQAVKGLWYKLSVFADEFSVEVDFAAAVVFALDAHHVPVNL